MLAPLVVYLLAFLIYAPTASTVVVSDDVHAAAVGAWRIAGTGDPWTDGFDVELLGRDDAHTFNFEAKNGHMVVFRSPGVVAVNVPGAWMSGATTDPETFTLVPQALTAAVLGALSVAFLFSALRRRLRTAHAVLATSVFALGTPMWSVAANATWTHTVTVLGITGMAWAASRNSWWLVGFWGGIAVWGRLHVALVVALVGIGVALARRQPSIALAVGLPSVALTALASVWTHWMYGSWLPTGGYGASDYANNLVGERAGMVDGLINHAGLWLAPDRGFLVWTPVLCLLLPAVVRSWHQLPDWSRSLMVGGVVYTLVQGQLNDFDGGDAFYGYRLGLEMLACSAPAYALSAHRIGRVARALVGPVIGLQVAAIAIGSLGNALFLPDERAWTDNAFVHALVQYPALAIWLVLMVTAGALGAVAWRQRGFNRALPGARQEGDQAVTGDGAGPLLRH